ncbi:hypothetical protein [Aliiglaciecola sp. NS0011-25]|uniref:hypothetical protein n=1 Tax=Aliiglaciecola sp. NS0011-25 TaxID=3127654 RepID=UPI0031098F57
MKKFEVFPVMDQHQKVESQLTALHKLMSLAGSQLDDESHLACMSICIDLDRSKSEQHNILKKAVFGGGD